jgi:nucleotide-binding universal stress UspA family protein
MVLACQLATERNSAIDALYVIEVPFNLPLDARLTEERANAEAVMRRASTIAEQFGVKLTPIIVTARSAGRAIVGEAAARRSEVIVLGSQSKRRVADRVFGRTIDYVLQHLPCEVIINVVPKKEGVVAPAATIVAEDVVAEGVVAEGVVAEDVVAEDDVRPAHRVGV